ncbi:ATP-dependent zinc metalloprotease ftsh mitochondrial-like [Quillaja saponaria]|uniref:ATP-dependent zinc metalloprotease ftsh mitochondrial-like n=1 Tax=Quillaja saponaria TaxID=32244 RepID=A0AAD7LYD0_QUISA|nr:ATP-dependent zinc metalloprotease ftsh mitochondrial-like [Quillaja saponaria]
MIIARGTPGFSGADLANLVDIAATKAAMDGAQAVSMADLEYAKDKIMMGSERKSAVTSDESRRLTAFHESGHVLAAIHTDGALPVHKATIVPRGMALGMVTQLLDKQWSQLTKYGMNKAVGLVAHNYDDNGESTSTETRLLIEKEVKNYLERAYNNAKTILTTNSKELHALANALVEHDTLTGSQTKALLVQVNSQQQQVVAEQSSSQSNLVPPSTPLPSSCSCGNCCSQGEGYCFIGVLAKTSTKCLS